jgi:hypothetical protein
VLHAALCGRSGKAEPRKPRAADSDSEQDHRYMIFIFARKAEERFEGRMEKRLPIAVVVHLVPVQDQSADRTELTYTDNISAHGACAVSKRPWRPGEVAEIKSLKEQITLRGKVAHCRKRSDNRYVVGLTFQSPHGTGSIYRSYAST